MHRRRRDLFGGRRTGVQADAAAGGHHARGRLQLVLAGAGDDQRHAAVQRIVDRAVTAVGDQRRRLRQPASEGDNSRTLALPGSASINTSVARPPVVASTRTGKCAALAASARSADANRRGQRALRHDHRRPAVVRLPQRLCRRQAAAAQQADEAHAARQVVTLIFQRRGSQLQETLAAADQRIGERAISARPPACTSAVSSEALLYFIEQHARFFILPAAHGSTPSAAAPAGYAGHKK